MNLNFLRYSLSVLFVLVLLISSPVLSFGQNEDKTKFLGTGSCSSSNCHGSVVPRNGTNIVQNEYVIWQKQDKHSQAWLALASDDSKRIAQNLGIKDPTSDSTCLKCHSTYVHQESMAGEKFTKEDGVSCESCHGAAEGWIKTHTDKDSSHAENVRNGMKDLMQPHDRASLCLSCHYGTDDQFVSHRIMGAGHPRLTFESDTYGMTQPPHWNVDEDYVKRKGSYDSTRHWLVGQGVRAESILNQLLSSKRSSSNRFPELTMFYCYNCHHSLSEKQWKSHNYEGKPGVLNHNISSIVIVGEALKVLDPSKQLVYLGLLTNMLEAKTDDEFVKGATGLKSLLSKDILKTLSDINLSSERSKKLLLALVEYGAVNSSLPYEIAEQIVMGMSSVIASLSKDGSLYKGQMEQLYKTLGSPEAYNPKAFSEACLKFKAIL